MVRANANGRIKWPINNVPISRGFKKFQEILKNYKSFRIYLKSSIQWRWSHYSMTNRVEMARMQRYYENIQNTTTTYFYPKTSNSKKDRIFQTNFFHFLQECVEEVYFGAYMVPSIKHFFKVVSGSQMACVVFPILR